MQQATSSIPPPFSLSSIPPLKGSSLPPDYCRLTGKPVNPGSLCVHIPTRDGITYAKVDYASLCEAIGFDTDEERADLLQKFFGADRIHKRVLLWRKLSRHRPDLHGLILTALRKP